MTAQYDLTGRARSVYAILALAVLPTTTPAAAGDWRINPTRTTIGFAIDAVGFPRTEGRFHRFEG